VCSNATPRLNLITCARYSLLLRQPEITAHLQSAERVNQELKRRTLIARVFPNKSAYLHLITALLAKASDGWKTGEICLNMANQNPFSV
jgi:putative transposase